MRTIKYIIQFLIFLGVVVGGIYFGSENTDAIRIVLMGNLTDPIPIWFVVLLAFFSGAFLAGLYFSVELIRLWLKIRRFEKRRMAPPKQTQGSGGFRFSDSTPSGNPSSNPDKPKFMPFGSPTTTSVRPFGPPPPLPPGVNKNR